jgi:hypothetical protein
VMLITITQPRSGRNATIEPNGDSKLLQRRRRPTLLRCNVSDASGPYRAQASVFGFQHQGMSSSMRSCGQPLTRRVSSSVM